MNKIDREINISNTWLTKREAAKYLGVSESTIYNLESEGTLRGYRINNDSKRPIVRFKREDLDEMLMRRQKGRPRQIDVN